MRVFGAASTEANQDGTYTLQYSEYAQAIHAQADDPYYTWGSAAETDRPQNDLFANNSQNGNIKLHVNAQ